MQRFHTLDGLRGVFALVVVLYHLPFATHLFANPLVRDGYLAVDFFFVLSGFVIAFAYGDRLQTAEAAGNFVVRRLGRIWPLHAVMLAALLLLELVKLVALGGGDAFTGESDPVAFVASLALVQAWGIYDAPTWNVPSWSISAELLAYLGFAVISLVAPRRSEVLALVIAAASAAGLLLLAGDMDQAGHLAPLRVGFGFFAGVVVYAAYRRWPSPQQWSFGLASLIEVAVLGAVIGYFALVQRGQLGLVAPLLFAVAIYVYAGGRGVVSSVLASAPLQFVGKVSFSIYLVHFVINAGLSAVAQLGERVLGGSLRDTAATIFGPAVPIERGDWLLINLGSLWANDALAVAYVAVLLLVASLTYQWIERPGQQLFARLTPREAGRVLPA